MACGSARPTVKGTALRLARRSCSPISSPIKREQKDGSDFHVSLSLGEIRNNCLAALKSVSWSRGRLLSAGHAPWRCPSSSRLLSGPSHRKGELAALGPCLSGRGAPPASEVPSKPGVRPALWEHQGLLLCWPRQWALRPRAASALHPPPRELSRAHLTSGLFPAKSPPEESRLLGMAEEALPDLPVWLPASALSSPHAARDGLQMLRCPPTWHRLLPPPGPPFHSRPCPLTAPGCPWASLLSGSVLWAPGIPTCLRPCPPTQTGLSGLTPPHSSFWGPTAPRPQSWLEGASAGQ
ncbi:uncharacterized protein LOC119516904 [Choloepus didactylus]|uniref:uncharacterized protein LOC119516904 n=1 Tax=Choloepus didactylus TaxID=27675 RepID=UPI00189E5C60|nr:uncharacterized protein LOC119516904 [Choloepus didactylus]